MEIGSRIYFEINTGEVIQLVGERRGSSVVPTTVEQDIFNYKSLNERNRESYGYIELNYGQFAQDFAACNGYRVNPETQQIEFSYPDPNEIEPQVPVYITPLSEQVAQLQEDTNTIVETVVSTAEDVGAVAETVIVTAEDLSAVTEVVILSIEDMTAITETVVTLSEQIASMQDQINQLIGGNAE